MAHADESKTPTSEELVQASRESLRLIVQSQIVLTDLMNNQQRLENLIHDLEKDTDS